MTLSDRPVPSLFAAIVPGAHDPTRFGFPTLIAAAGSARFDGGYSPLQSKTKPQPNHDPIAASLEASGAKGSYDGRKNLADSAQESYEHTKE